MRLYHCRLTSAYQKPVVVETRWGVLKGEQFMDLRVDAALFIDPDQAEAYADAIIEAAARMRGHQTNRLERKNEPE